MLFPTADFALFFFVVFCASWATVARPDGRKLIPLAQHGRQRGIVFLDEAQTARKENAA